MSTKLTADDVLGMFDKLGHPRAQVISALDAAVGPSGVFNAFQGQKFLAEAAFDELPPEEQEAARPVLDRLVKIELRKWRRVKPGGRSRTAQALMEVVGDKYECCDAHRMLFEKTLDMIDEVEREVGYEDQPEIVVGCRRCSAQFTTRDHTKGLCIECSVEEARTTLPERLKIVMLK